MTTAIRWCAKGGRFYFGDKATKLAAVGAALAWAVSRGEQVQLQFREKSPGGGGKWWSVMVSPAYVMQMLEFVAENGWFWDEVEEYRPHSDHKFDPENITPGMNWRVVSEMRLGADELRKQAQWDENEAQCGNMRRKRKAMLARVTDLRKRADEMAAAAESLFLASVPV